MQGQKTGRCCIGSNCICIHCSCHNRGHTGPRLTRGLWGLGQPAAVHRMYTHLLPKAISRRVIWGPLGSLCDKVLPSLQLSFEW